MSKRMGIDAVPKDQLRVKMDIMMKNMFERIKNEPQTFLPNEDLKQSVLMALLILVSFMIHDPTVPQLDDGI